MSGRGAGTILLAGRCSTVVWCIALGAMGALTIDGLLEIVSHVVEK